MGSWRKSHCGSKERKTTKQISGKGMDFVWQRFLKKEG